MKAKYTVLLVVKDLQKAKAFYKKVFGLHTIADFGANITLTGGLSLQTSETWLELIEKKDEDLCFGSNVMELYFEEEDFDAFIKKLTSFSDIKYLQQVKEARWGQRYVRIFDEDDHIIEIGESLSAVIKRFQVTGMSLEEIAKRMDIDSEYVTTLSKEAK